MGKLGNAFKAFRNIITGKLSSGVTDFMSEAAREDFNEPLTLDAVKTNSYVNIAVGKIATNAARVKIELKRGDDLITNGPIFELFKWVNPNMSESQLIQASSSWWNTRGEFFWIFQAELPGKIPSSIIVPDPRYMYSAKDKERQITIWEYRIPGQQGIPLLPHEVLHVKDWNPFSATRGVNPLYAMTDELTSDFYANVLNNALLKNRATPDGILTSDQTISEEQAKDIKQRWEKAHATGSAHGIAVLGKGTEYKPVALSLADMEFYTMKKWNRTTIAGKYGVPPAVMGYKDENTPLSGADTKEQMQFFWMQTILPFLKIVADKVNSDFMSIYDSSLKFTFGLEDIFELAEDSEKLRERVRADIAAGLILINEGREEIGKDPVSWGDTWYKPINLVPVNVKPIEKDLAIETDDRDVSILFGEPDNRDVKELFKSTEVYDDTYKNTHWWALQKHVNMALTNSKKDMGTWLYAMRSNDLEYEALDEFNKLLTDREEFFEAHRQELTNVVYRMLIGINEITVNTLNKFYEEMEVENIGIELSDKVKHEYIGHSNYFFNLLKGELIKVADKKLFYNQMKAVTGNFISTEGLTLFNEIRTLSFEGNGFKAHIWVSPKDGSETDLDVDGEIRLIGQAFSNGKVVPDNRSITLPVEIKR